MSKEFQEGYDAAIKSILHIHSSENPYQSHTCEWAEWEDGWQCATEEYYDDYMWDKWEEGVYW